MPPFVEITLMIDMAERISPTRFNTNIYAVLEKYLRAAKEPLTCVDLLEHADVRSITDDANRISNYLGHMWRKGMLQRHQAPPSDLSMARFAYTWKAEAADKVVPIEGIKHFTLEGKDGDDVTVKRVGNVITLEAGTFRLVITLK